MKPKHNSLKQQRISGELETIIEEFGRAMRNANRTYVSRPATCVHDSLNRMTPVMYVFWLQYLDFCRRNPK